MAARYDHIRPDAIQQNLLTYSGGQYHDVAGRPESPYFSDTSFVGSLLFNTVNTLHPVITLPSDLMLKNLGWTVSSVEVDADDGLGYRSLPVGGSLAVDYATEGSKDLRIRFYDGTRTWYAHTPLEVSQPPANPFAGYAASPDEQYWVTGIKPYLGCFARAKVQFFYSCGAKLLRRPLIVVEGFEFPGVLPPIGYKQLFDKIEDVLWPGQSPTNLKDYFSQEGYDLIYVDFENNVDYIQRNAFLMEEVIRLVNQKKAEANSTEQNVVLGVSLGGLICKYALVGSNQQRITERSVSTSSSLLIASNPATSSFTIALPDSPSILRVWDALGRMRHEQVSVSGAATVDVSIWANGVYFIEVIEGNLRQQAKVVVQR